MHTTIGAALIIIILLVIFAYWWHKQALKFCKINQAMRKLWLEHVYWTREFIIHTLEGSKSQTASADRLMKNQDDIGAAFATVYGKDAGDKLAALLREHISIAAQIVTSVAGGKDITDLKNQWSANADKISYFLHSCNPAKWPLAKMQKMMDDHLALTSAELVDYSQHKYVDAISDFEKVSIEILHMADILTIGLV